MPVLGKLYLIKRMSITVWITVMDFYMCNYYLRTCPEKKKKKQAVISSLLNYNNLNVENF